MYPSRDFKYYQLIANLVFSIPHPLRALAYYFEVNPRHNSISSINVSFCISKRWTLYFLNKTTIPSHTGRFGRIPNAWTLDQLNQNIWGWDPGIGSFTKLPGDSNVVTILGLKAEIEWSGLRSLTKDGHT